jgi:hypothetical protein
MSDMVSDESSPPPAKLAESNMDCFGRCIPAKPGCGKFLIPRFDVILKEGQPSKPKVVLVDASYHHEKSEFSFHSLYLNNFQPQGIDPSISSTVLRL